MASSLKLAKCFFTGLLWISFLFTGNIHAQEYKVSEIIRTPVYATIDVSGITNDYFPNLTCVEQPLPATGISRSELEKIKASLPQKTTGTTETKFRGSVPMPVLIHGKEANIFSGHVPNDNDIAVSNDHKIISVTNSVIYYYDDDTMYHKPVSLDTFGSSFKRKEGKYDPRVVYDPISDRFIMVFLNGFNDSTSYIFMGFSKTNDPAGEWNIYMLEGNPMNDTSWTDFPMIAITQEELFLTVNLLKNDEHWKTGFKQTIIWQINKQSGYNGDQLISLFYSGIGYGGKPIRNLCPIQGGSAPTGPNIYFLSNKNFSTGCDSIFLVEVTGKIGQPGTKLNIDLLRSDSMYGVPPYADMPNSRFLETNDARILDGYIENGIIRFTGNTINFNNNKASVYLGKVTNLTTSKDVKLEIIDHAYLEFGYPSISYTGNNNADEAIILADFACDTVFPGVCAFFYKNGALSDILRLKEGNSWVNVQSGKYQRWGDYSGLQRVYNEDGAVWGAGYFGKYKSSLERLNGTWIGKIKSPTYKSIETVSKNVVMVYPNPAIEMFTVVFDNDEAGICEFKLYTIEGKLVKHLLTQLVRQGKYEFTFSTEPLKPGNYFLSVEKQGKEVVSKAINIR